MTQQDIELTIFRALGAAGAVLPGEQVSAIAETVLNVAMIAARAEVSQAVAAEIVADRARERAAATDAIKATEARATEAVEDAKAEAAREVQAARAELKNVLPMDKTLIRRLNAADAKVMRRDAKIKELQRELRKMRERAASRAEVLNEVEQQAALMNLGRETVGKFGDREVVKAEGVDEFLAWLAFEQRYTRATTRVEIDPDPL